MEIETRRTIRIGNEVKVERPKRKVGKVEEADRELAEWWERNAKPEVSHEA